MRISKKIVSILLLVAMLITSLPIGTVYAGNNDSLPSNPSVGQGSSDWKYAEDWEGIRVSLYWAESEEHFKRNENVVQIGETKDFSKTGPRYKVDEYTTYSIYRYMNGDNEGRGKSYDPELNKFNPYYYVDKDDSSVVSNLPPVWNGTKAQWDNWIEGNNYKNIEEISRLLGERVTAEDFMSGDLVVDGYQVKSKGSYKLFIEPIIYPTVAGKGMVLTLRDAIRWEEAFNRGEIKPPSMIGSSGNPYTPSLTMNLLPIFEYVANSQFLIEDEPAISMTANSSNYRVDGSTGSSARREEVRKEIKKGGKIYSSLGVGVFTSPNIVPGNEANLVITYVKIIGINPDGSIKYEQIRSEVLPAELDENGRVMNIEEVVEIEEGTAYLNDIIVSPKDLTESGNVIWEKVLPEGIGIAIEPNSNDVWRYNLGKLTDIYKNLLSNMSSEVYSEHQSVVNRLDEIIRKGVNATKLEIQEMSTIMLELEKASVSFGELRTQTRIINKAIEIKDLDDVILDTEQPLEIEVDITIGNNNSISTFTEYIEEKQAKSGSGTIEVKRSVGYLRYIVYGVRKEIIFEEMYKDGVLIDTTIKEKDIPLVEISPGLVSDEVAMTDKTSEGFSFVEYKTAKELLNTMPSSPIKQGSVYEIIKGMDVDENVYVRWRKDITTAAPSGDVVQEWRLSKLVDSLGYENQAYMGLQLFRSRGHAGQWLTPSGSYSYKTLNPNGQVTVDNSPSNMKYLDWLHSKALTKGSYSVTLGNPRVYVDITGNVNYIKSSQLSGYKAATWVNSSGDRAGLQAYDIASADKGTIYSGSPSINKQTTLKYGIENIHRYIHTYSVYDHYFNGVRMVCDCYSQSGIARPTYETADYNINVVFDRHSTVNTDSRLYKLNTPIEKVENGKTTLSKQEGNVLNVYPEVPMLFENNDGVESIKFVVGEQPRKVQPVSFHKMEYEANVKLTTVGMSVATSSQAKQTANVSGIGNKPVIHKGSGLTITSEVKKSSTSNERGHLVVKTFALDLADSVKNSWGNGGYNPSIVNNNFLSLFGKVEGGKWVFQAEATEKLEIGNTYTGPVVKNGVKYTEKSKNEKTHTLTLRGGTLTHVNGTPINTVKANNPTLYEALEGMKLVGSKESTVLSTFEHQTGKALTENSFKDLAKTARNGVDNLEVGKGWYSEDSTVLVVKEYTTVLEIPTTGFTDKIPMTVKGLETPVNKMQFYTKIEKGHSIVRYSIKGSSLVSESYFEYNSKIGDKFGNKEVNYGVPNVSISDTTGLF